MHSNRLENMWVSKVQGQRFTWDSLKRTYLIESLSIHYILFFYYYTCNITFCSRVGLILMVVSFQVHVEHMNQVLDCVD